MNEIGVHRDLVLDLGGGGMVGADGRTILRDWRLDPNVAVESA